MGKEERNERNEGWIYNIRIGRQRLQFFEFKIPAYGSGGSNYARKCVTSGFLFRKVRITLPAVMGSSTTPVIGGI